MVKEKREKKLERPIYGAEHFGLIFCVALYMTDSTLHNHPESQMNAFMEGLGVGIDDEDNSDYEDDQFTSGWFVMDFPSPSIPMAYSMNSTLSLKCSSSANIYIFTDSVLFAHSTTVRDLYKEDKDSMSPSTPDERSGFL